MRFEPGFVYLVIGPTEVNLADDSGVLVIDGFGGGWMTPTLIRRRVDEYRKMADAKDITVVLVTTCPVAMNCFGHDDYEEVFVRGRSLLDLHDADWLCHCSLGSLYQRERLEVE